MIVAGGLMTGEASVEIEERDLEPAGAEVVREDQV